jgi:hypothetical protein
MSDQSVTEEARRGAALLQQELVAYFQRLSLVDGGQSTDRESNRFIRGRRMAFREVSEMIERLDIDGVRYLNGKMTFDEAQHYFAKRDAAGAAKAAKAEGDRA